MADTLQQVENVTTQRGKKKTAKIVVIILLVAAAGFGVLGYIIWDQKQQIEKIAQKKDNLDKQIAKINLAMQIEGDPEKLQALEDQLTALTGKAQQAIGEMAKKDKDEAQKLAETGDELDREIRRILRKFDADTYAVPPIFKERLKHYIEVKTANARLTRQVYARKKTVWPIIVKEFSALGLPEEIAYVAWQESSFDPLALSSAGARGMWQVMDFQARKYGLRVDQNWRNGGHDDRTDVAKSTRIAAKYLYDLLSEFGSDSFMLAIASYNKGENGMRRVLHSVGFRKEQRDFWHLYRLKKLPGETMEYVPQILAAAIINGNPKKYGLE
jgi:soluble lytic murein transglycosylase-like protein